MKEVYEFLKNAGVYYLATLEGDQPRVRPFGTIDLFEDKLYFQTGKVKKVANQLKANPKVELSAMTADGKWIRIAATAVLDENIAAQEHMLAGYPSLQVSYKPGDGNIEVYYLKDVTAEICSFTEPTKTIRFCFFWNPLVLRQEIWLNESRECYIPEEIMDTAKYEALKLENQLCFPLYACSKEIIRQYKPFLDELDLTYTQYIVMMVLWEKRSLNVKDLGSSLYLDSGTLTPLLKKLEAKGYLCRSRSEKDERNLIVSVTEQGDALREKAVEIPEKMAQCTRLSPEDAVQLYRILYQILGTQQKSEDA